MRQAVLHVFYLSVIVLLPLTGCGGAAPSTAQQIVDQFKAAGLEVENPHQPRFEANSPFPRGFNDGLVFDLPSLGAMPNGEPRHGTVLVCESKQRCDVIYAYFDGLKGLLGPHYWQGADGTVVVYLDGTLPGPQAAKYEAIVKGLP